MKSVWGDTSVAKADLERDARYRWFVEARGELERSGDLVEFSDPTGGAIRKVAEIGLFSIYRCAETGFRYANPRLSTAAALRHFAEADYSDYFATVEKTKETRREIAYRPLLDFVASHCPAPASILEVGCGSGALLEFLRDAGGYEVEGVEIAPDARPYQDAKRLKVYQEPIESLRPGRVFSVVLMWSVLDHLADPLAALNACNRVLEPGGAIVIGNVNTDGFDHLLMGYDNYTFRPPGRVNYYNLRALSAHLSACGFEVVDVSTPGRLDIEMVRSYWAEDRSRPRMPFLDDLLTNPSHCVAAAKFQDFLSSNCLSGYQRILARKRG
ncbi:MAG: class I SAM-dependent methyltransferase [Alphaproteobacteria bacterium]|jgi:2-polyprenyl-3-methyl-5-hydroxy-6-metoxy-1,4-benzoquinol methylase